MSSNARKARRGAMVRNMARNIVGQPKPTHAISRSQGAVRRAVVEEAPPERFIHLTGPRTAFPRITSTSDVAFPKVPVKVRPSVYNKVSDVVQYSPEILAHVNFLREAQGDDAVTTFLNEGQKNGTIEQALADAEEKVRYFNKEMLRCQGEVTKWSAVVESLRQTINIISGKTPIAAPGQPTITPGGRRNWRGVLESALATGPLTFRQLLDVVVKAGGSKASGYSAVNNALKSGAIISDETGYHLPAKVV